MICQSGKITLQQKVLLPQEISSSITQGRNDGKEERRPEEFQQLIYLPKIK
jgi:hypothetical protein